LGKTPTAFLFPYARIVGRTRCTITIGMVRTDSRRNRFPESSPARPRNNDSNNNNNNTENSPTVILLLYLIIIIFIIIVVILIFVIIGHHVYQLPLVTTTAATISRKHLADVFYVHSTGADDPYQMAFFILQSIVRCGAHIAGDVVLYNGSPGGGGRVPNIYCISR